MMSPHGGRGGTQIYKNRGQEVSLSPTLLLSLSLFLFENMVEHGESLLFGRAHILLVVRLFVFQTTEMEDTVDDNALKFTLKRRSIYFGV